MLDASLDFMSCSERYGTYGKAIDKLSKIM
jgi:hypothetical protein